jgi:hypothetical protein
MIRALLRLLSMFALAIAIIMAVLDATRSIAADQLVLTPLATSWASFSPQTLANAERLVVDNLPRFFWDPVATTVLAAPGFLAFTVLALLLYMAGRRPTRRTSRFALES